MSNHVQLVHWNKTTAQFSGVFAVGSDFHSTVPNTTECNTSMLAVQNAQQCRDPSQFILSTIWTGFTSLTKQTKHSKYLAILRSTTVGRPSFLIHFFVP